MATFTEKQEYKVEVIPPYSSIGVRRADIVFKDDVEVGRTYHRELLHPGDDVSSKVQLVQQIAAATWTSDVVAAYAASIAEPEPAPIEEEPTPNLVPDPDPEPELEPLPEPPIPGS
jgi:hypothetical protein